MTSALFLRRLDAIAAIALAFLSFLLYLHTLAPDVLDADGGELQFAAWNFSFVHPTGYPLYLILGGLFQHLTPFGNPAFRLNIFTALTAASAVAAVYLAANVITRQRAIAVVAAATFALSRTFWYDGSGAETYDLNAFFVALLIYLALRWQATLSARTFAAFAFVLGLAVTHHRTIVLWMPAFALFFLFTIWQLRLARTRQPIKQKLAFSVFIFLIPLSLYLYVPLRAPMSPYAVLPLAPGRDLVLYDNSPASLIDYLLGRVFQTELRWDAVSLARLESLPQLVIDQFTLVGLVFGIAGMAVMLWRREWARFALLAVGSASTALFASLYQIGDIFHYYIPVFLVWALWAAAGVSGIFELAGGRASTKSRVRLASSGILLSASILLPFQFSSNLPVADRSKETRERTQWVDILAAPIPPNAILISNDRDEMMPLWYMQYVEGAVPHLLGLFPLITPAPQYTGIGPLTDSVLDTGRTVYLIKPMPGIEIKYRVAAVLPLVKVLGLAADTPPQFISTGMLANQVQITGYSVAREARAMRVAVYWRPQAKLTQDYATFVHLFDSNGSKVAQGNDHRVGGDYYPSSMWRVGETLVDEQIISLPPDLAPGRYHLLAGMYAQPGSEMLGEPADIGAVEIP